VAKTLYDLTKGQMPRTVDDLDELRARIQKWNKPSKIKKKGSAAVFTVYVSGELIEGWQLGEEPDEEWDGGGWLYILEHYPEIFPHISDTLHELGLHEVRAEFEGIATLFPLLAEFNELDLVDGIDFLKDSVTEIYDARLRRYSQEARVQFSAAFSKIVERLDHLSKQIWAETKAQEGWEGLFRYIEQIYDRE